MPSACRGTSRYGVSSDFSVKVSLLLCTCSIANRRKRMFQGNHQLPPDGPWAYIKKVTWFLTILIQNRHETPLAFGYWTHATNNYLFWNQERRCTKSQQCEDTDRWILEFEICVVDVRKMTKERKKGPRRQHLKTRCLFLEVISKCCWMVAH